MFKVVVYMTVSVYKRGGFLVSSSLIIKTSYRCEEVLVKLVARWTKEVLVVRSRCTQVSWTEYSSEAEPQAVSSRELVVVVVRGRSRGILCCWLFGSQWGSLVMHRFMCIA